MSDARRAAAALAAGVLAVPALPPWHLWPLLFAGLSLLYGLLATLPWGSWPRAALLGWCFGFGWFAGGLWWIANALLVPGYPFRWVWPLAVAALPAVLALFPALACALAMRAFALRRTSGWLAFVAATTIAEWLRGHVLSGFPWNLHAAVWSDWPALMQTAALGGVWLTSFATTFWATLPGFLAVRDDGPGRALPALGPALAAFALASFVACLGYGHARLGRPVEWVPDLRVRVVQPAIPQADKADPRKAEQSLATLLELSGREPGGDGATLIVWPETALTSRTLALPRVRRALADGLGRHAAPTHLVTGVRRHERAERGPGRYYNSVVVLDRSAAPIAVYDKAHLVPFAERVPFRSVLRFAPFVHGIASFTPGPGPATIGAGESVPAFSPAICYEVVFPGAVVPARGPRPRWILNVTNDAWFGDSPGPHQHFAQARFRAVEEGLPVVRAANAGISGVVDPFGRVVTASALFERTVVTARLPRALPPTPYARLGDVPAFVLAGLTLAVAGMLRRRGR